MNNKKSDDSNLPYVPTSKLIELLASARRDLNALRQRGTSKAKFDKQAQLCQSIRRELHGRTDCRDCYKDTGNWTYEGTIEFAALDILDDLYLYNKKNYFAIDNGLLLYSDSGYASIDISTVKVSSKFTNSLENKLIDPTEQQLLESGLDFYDKDIETYLRQKAIGGAEGNYQYKVGLKGIAHPVNRPDIGQPLKLEVVPVSYWTIREFNRSMLKDNADPMLLQLREKSYERIFDEQHRISIICPSAFYVEVTIVTKDRQIVILEKNRNLSAVANRGLPWTCTVEEGFGWVKDFKDGKLDIGGTVKRCLAQELKLNEDLIINMNFFGIAMEYTHLNTAILGTVVLDITSTEMLKSIMTSEDYGLRYEFTSLEDAFQKYFSDANQTGMPWHPLARMRLLLTLVHHQVLEIIAPPNKPQERVFREMIKRNEIFISYSHVDDDWHKQMRTHLVPHFRNKPITVWDDTHINPGQEWGPEIKNALQRAKVAILLVSPDFLASDYIHENELPDIFKAAANEGLTIVWIAIRPSGYAATSISKLQCAHKNPDRALSKRSKAERETVFANVATYVASLFTQD